MLKYCPRKQTEFRNLETLVYNSDQKKVAIYFGDAELFKSEFFEEYDIQDIFPIKLPN